MLTLGLLNRFALYGDVQLEDDISESKLISTQMKLRNDVVVEPVSLCIQVTWVSRWIIGRNCQQAPTYRPT